MCPWELRTENLLPVQPRIYIKSVFAYHSKRKVLAECHQPSLTHLQYRKTPSIAQDGQQSEIHATISDIFSVAFQDIKNNICQKPCRKYIKTEHKLWSNKT